MAVFSAIFTLIKLLGLAIYLFLLEKIISFIMNIGNHDHYSSSSYDTSDDYDDVDYDDCDEE